jgi:hypothetical protein
MIIITLGIISLVIVIKLLRIGIKAGKESYKEPPEGSIIIQPDLEEYEMDEHSPENLKFNSTLKAAILRTKLHEIEMERDEVHSAPFIPMTIDDYLLLRRMKGYDI